ncbi:DNA-binding transcriptional regulator, LysR family [Streptoalloteichus tenebrarius]|uniref:DNA-binding transcriptional regulator, LysR family n=1 Tax=Streptoalloteichus tenebrarius (strain ATCC 17920 / DSM 40477 / JCM 4838 / CBS 697.72 / NBRC 16177 / NCIMB 11028 / NRRL B-12390 / A12253. 1 / ISP 5477) TaxID=1933 RepID=A0ABT1HWR6_STRSD|nr:LysR family transcriptional regulator [Streptoalloteichus tenebrarius]MCP2259945.1 DNA-binding transcriptional regulator, LysR family [Streptoalloteichus tenebrarius]BFF03270.1 LysR family transcriptional regulator [Streptoalloteichus tenebrarius]
MIDPRRLRVLRALADHGTVTAAARSLYLTPSAVSQQLAALESEVGQPLLDRRGRAVRLTAAGEILASHASAVLAQLERAEADLAACASGAAGRVVVAAFATAITMVVAPAIADLRARAPKVEVLVRDAEGHASLPLLLAGEVDMAIAMDYRGAPGADDERLARVPLYAEPFDAVLPATHRLAEEDGVAVGELAAEEWITPWPGNPCHDVVQLACENAGFQPRVAHSSDDFRAICALAGAGVGVALVPRSALRGVELRDAVIRPVTGRPPTRRVFAALRRGGERHPLLGMTLDALRTAAEALDERAEGPGAEGSGTGRGEPV